MNYDKNREKCDLILPDKINMINLINSEMILH